MKIFTVQILCTWSLHLIIGGKNGNQSLFFDSTDENKELLEKYTKLWDGIKNKSETINADKKGEYDKDFMKIKFDSDDDLSLNKPLKLDMFCFWRKW